MRNPLHFSSTLLVKSAAGLFNNDNLDLYNLDQYLNNNNLNRNYNTLGNGNEILGQTIGGPKGIPSFTFGMQPGYTINPYGSYTPPQAYAATTAAQATAPATTPAAPVTPTTPAPQPPAPAATPTTPVTPPTPAPQPPAPAAVPQSTTPPAGTIPATPPAAQPQPTPKPAPVTTPQRPVTMPSSNPYSINSSANATVLDKPVAPTPAPRKEGLIEGVPASQWIARNNAKQKRDERNFKNLTGPVVANPNNPSAQAASGMVYNSTTGQMVPRGYNPYTGNAPSAQRQTAPAAAPRPTAPAAPARETALTPEQQKKLDRYNRSAAGQFQNMSKSQLRAGVASDVYGRR